MARVSLVLPLSPAARPPVARIPALRRVLEEAGHDVEVLVVGATAAETVPEGPGWWYLEASSPGVAAAAVEGLLRARGDLLLVLDPEMGYAPADLARVAEPLARDRADVVVASRCAGRATAGARRRWRRWIGAVSRPLAGTADPCSGLIGLTRAALDGAGGTFEPAGAKFSFELLARVHGRRRDVPVRITHPGRRARPGIDDVRLLKRLSDHRFGNLSRLLQFCAVGGSGMVVDLSCYGAFQPLLAGIPALARHVVPPTQVSVALALARALAIAVALVWNFSLNRRLTFNYARHGSRARQFVTYVLGNALSIALSLALSLGLPRKVPFFNEHKILAAVVGIVAATGLSFSMSRWVVFSHPSGTRASHPRRPDPAQPSVCLSGRYDSEG
jgi:dolichol-phosphate mannosyltransferase